MRLYQEARRVAEVEAQAVVNEMTGTENFTFSEGRATGENLPPDLCFFLQYRARVREGQERPLPGE